MRLKTYEDYENRRREVLNKCNQIQLEAHKDAEQYLIKDTLRYLEIIRRSEEEAKQYFEDNWVEIPLSVQAEEGLRYVKELAKAYNEMPEEEQ